MVKIFFTKCMSNDDFFFLNLLDVLIPKIPFSFFADLWVWVTWGPGVNLVRILGVLSIEPLLGEGGF